MAEIKHELTALVTDEPPAPRELETVKNRNAERSTLEPGFQELSRWIRSRTGELPNVSTTASPRGSTATRLAEPSLCG